MQEPTLTHSWLRVLSLASLFAIVPFAQAQDESDPWFSETRESKQIAADEEEPSKSIVQTGSDSWATYRRIMGDYKNTPDENLNRRIQLLSAAMSSYSKSIDKHEDELAALKSQLDAIRAELSRNDLGELSVEQQLELIAAHRKYFLADTALLVELLNSKLMQSVETKLADVSRSGKFERLEALEASIATHGIKPILGDRFNSAMRSTLNAGIARRWENSKFELGAPAGANYLVGRLIDAPSLKLTLQVQTPTDADEALRSGIRQAIEQRWVNDFNVVMAAQPLKSADLLVEVNLDAIDTQVSEETAVVTSTIPGRVTEEPNPDFMALSKKYEKEARRFESAMAMYGTTYEEYLRQFEDKNAERLEDQLRGRDNNAPPPPPPSGGPGSEGMGESMGDALARNAEQVTDNAIQMMTIPEPRPPEPVHLEILEELYQMPSTLVTSEESTDYEYMQRTLRYTFRSKSDIAIKAPDGTPLAGSEPVELQQARSWTKNEGVARNDPTVTEGDFSDQAVRSAELLFGLELGARCAKAIGALMEKALPALQNTPSSQKLENALLALSIKVQRGDYPNFALTAAELRDLAKIANDPNVSDKAFQEECLRLVAQKGSLAVTL